MVDPSGVMDTHYFRRRRPRGCTWRQESWTRFSIDASVQVRGLCASRDRARQGAVSLPTTVIESLSSVAVEPYVTYPFCRSSIVMLVCGSS